MKPLVVSLLAFLTAVLLFKLISGKANYRLSGNIAMCTMLAFTAIGHFLYVYGMAMMIPEFVQFKTGLVYFTGVLEIAMGLALLFPKCRKIGSVLIIGFLVAALPANIYGAVKRVDFTDPSGSGPGVEYLWLRIPLQLFFIGWVYYFSARKQSQKKIDGLFSILNK